MLKALFLFVVVMKTWQDRVNLYLPTLVLLAIERLAPLPSTGCKKRKYKGQFGQRVNCTKVDMNTTTIIMLLE